MITPQGTTERFNLQIKTIPRVKLGTIWRLEVTDYLVKLFDNATSNFGVFHPVSIIIELWW